MISVDEFYAAEADRVDAKWLEGITEQIRSFIATCPPDVPVALVTVRQ